MDLMNGFNKPADILEASTGAAVVGKFVVGALGDKITTYVFEGSQYHSGEASTVLYNKWADKIIGGGKFVVNDGEVPNDGAWWDSSSIREHENLGGKDRPANPEDAEKFLKQVVDAIREEVQRVSNQ